jgi:hypothetical protein
MHQVITTITTTMYTVRELFGLPMASTRHHAYVSFLVIKTALSHVSSKTGVA